MLPPAGMLADHKEELEEDPDFPAVFGQCPSARLRGPHCLDHQRLPLGAEILVPLDLVPTFRAPLARWKVKVSDVVKVRRGSSASGRDLGLNWCGRLEACDF